MPILWRMPNLQNIIVNFHFQQIWQKVLKSIHSVISKPMLMSLSQNFDTSWITLKQIDVLTGDSRNSTNRYVSKAVSYFSITLSEFIADNCKFRPVPLGLPFLTYSLTNEKNSHYIIKIVTGPNNSTDNNAINFNICQKHFREILDYKTNLWRFIKLPTQLLLWDLTPILSIFNKLYFIKYNLIQNFAEK